MYTSVVSAKLCQTVSQILNETDLYSNFVLLLFIDWRK